MSFFNPPKKPQSPLGYHRILSPTASVKVSPILLGGISIGNAWSELFGKSEDAFDILDAYHSLGGNFIDTANHYNMEESERLIGEWMETRGTRDQMVIATKYSAGYLTNDHDNVPLQSNFAGNSAKSLYVSVRDSLKKLRTEYIDILYVHWWDFGTSVAEVMRHLHTLIMSRQVLYLGVSDTPAWVVVKANEYARSNGLTPFSVYQGRWNAAFRDMEAEIIPMCEDQGMGIVSWASLGGGQLLSAEQRRQRMSDDSAPKGYGFNENDVPVSEALEQLAEKKGTTLQAAALAYLFHQSTYVFPIVGVQTVDQIRAMPDALRIALSKDEIQVIHNAAPFNPLFPISYLFDCKEGYGYNLSLNSMHVKNYQTAAWIDAPPKPEPYKPRTIL